MIVAFESIDAGGKATQAEAVCAFFNRDEFKSQIKTVKKFDFPHYQTTAGAVIGRILRGQTFIMDTDINNTERYGVQYSRDRAVILQSVMVADRLEHLQLLTEFALSPDNLLILDRYKLSGLVYGIADGLNAEWLQTIQSCLPDADLNILIDISVDESKRRRPERRDYYEKNFAMLEVVRDAYRDHFHHMLMDEPSEFEIIDGQLPVSEVTKKIVEAIWKRIGEAFTDD